MVDSVNDVLGVVVLYNCTIEESITLSSIKESLLKNSDFLDVVVYDNSERSEIESGSRFEFGNLKIHYFHDATNPGVSKAYNFGAKYGGGLRKKWLLLLDQDTRFPLDSIEKYISGINLNPDLKLFAPVLKLVNGDVFSPCKYTLKRGFALKKVTFGITSLQGISVLNSGMMIHLKSFSLVGGYDERVKLDFCDFLFIEKFKKVYSSCFIIDVTCEHDFSDDEKDVEKLNERFGIYCRDAKNCDQESFLDWVQYMIVVFGRASSLVLRTGKMRFYRTMIEDFIMSPLRG